MACFTWCHFLHTSVESLKRKMFLRNKSTTLMKVLVVTLYTQYYSNTIVKKGIAVKNHTFLFICRYMKNMLKNLVGLGHNVVLCVFMCIFGIHFFASFTIILPPPIVFSLLGKSLEMLQSITSASVSQ